MEHIKKCPNCKKDIIYKSRASLNRSKRTNANCRSCSQLIIKEKKRKELLIEKKKIYGKDLIFSRECPECEKELIYKNEGSLKIANKLNVSCVNCTRKRVFNTAEYKKKRSVLSIEQNKIYGNPFQNKKHTKETKQKISEKVKILVSGENNPMFGRTFYECWIDKYGIEEADIRLKDFKEKQSINTTGSNNPMYGKPSPKGSGNGWSGWYKGWFFRSLLELSYMVSIIERFNLNWKNAETNELKIEYVEDDINRNYFADFLIEDKYLIECKPKSLWNSKKVKLKKEAAIEYCKNRNLKYKMIDVKRLTTDEILNLYNNNKIKFTNRYEEKFREKYKN